MPRPNPADPHLTADPLGRLARTADLPSLRLLLEVRSRLWPDRPPVSIGLSAVNFSFHDQATVFRGASTLLTTTGAVLLLGPNGRGKTTALRLLAGRLKPSAGTVSPVSADRKLSFSGSDGADLPPYSKVSTVLEFLCPTYVQKALETLNLRSRRSARIGALSSGQRKRLSLFRALATGRDAVLLDEPLAHLDINARQEITQVLRTLKQDLPIVVATHSRHLVDSLLTDEQDCAYWVNGFEPSGGNGEILRIASLDEIEKLLRREVHRD